MAQIYRKDDRAEVSRSTKSSKAPPIYKRRFLCSPDSHLFSKTFYWFLLSSYFDRQFLQVNCLKARAWLTPGVGGGIFGPTPPPPPRYAHGLTAADGRLFVFGGSGESGTIPQLDSFHLQTKS